jgi:hypothetical protein
MLGSRVLCFRRLNQQQTNLSKSLLAFISNDILLSVSNKNVNRKLSPLIFNVSIAHSTFSSNQYTNRNDPVPNFSISPKRFATSSTTLYANTEQKLAEIDPIKHRQSELENKRIELELKEALKNDKYQQVLINKSPKFFEPYLRLMRLDKPAPIFLVYWPAAWAILGAASYQGSVMPDLYMLGLFGLGALAMRSSGCIINDIWDRKIDAQVERTKNRPLASGEIGLPGAITLLGLNLTASLSILLQLNLTTQVRIYFCTCYSLVILREIDILPVLPIKMYLGLLVIDQSF